MFGGAGIYRDGLMFALLAGEQLFLKCDELTKDRFSQAGCRSFVYEKNGKPVEMSYWSVPDEALDDREIMRVWADLALQAAERARKPTGKRKS
jgi:DNA transformation protein